MQENMTLPFTSRAGSYGAVLQSRPSRRPYHECTKPHTPNGMYGMGFIWKMWVKGAVAEGRRAWNASWAAE